MPSVFINANLDNINYRGIGSWPMLLDKNHDIIFGVFFSLIGKLGLLNRYMISKTIVYRKNNIL